MFSPVASTIFAYRNAEKTKNGEIGRSVVTVGQCTGVIQEISKYDNIFSASARSALKALESFSADNKLAGYAGKALKFTADNVNPLICASGVLKVAMSDDKVHDGITEAAALSGMFLGEALMKMHFNDIFSESSFKNAAAKVPQKSVLKWLSETILNSKHTGKAASILKGILFVCGSMGSYAAAQEVGKFYAEDIMKKLGIERKVKPEKQETQVNTAQKPEEKAETSENQSKDLAQKV